MFLVAIRENPKGETRKMALRLGLDGGLKLEFHGCRETRDAGSLARSFPGQMDPIVRCVPDISFQ